MLSTLYLTALLFSIASLPLDSVISRSDSCVGIIWTPDTMNTNPFWYALNGEGCTGADTVYRRCDFVPGLTYQGIAYSYGGEDPWYTFRTKLNLGFLAGSHQCHYEFYGDPSDTIAGIDCSGFLSLVWGYPRSTTRTFYSSSNFQTISFEELQPGDALVKASATCGYHAVLVLEAENLTEAVISEASSTVLGCRERVVDLTQTYWSCFKAIRYPGIATNVQHNDHLNTANLQITALRHKQSYRLHLSAPFSGSAALYTMQGKRIMEQQVHFQHHIDFSFQATYSGWVSILHLKPFQGAKKSLLVHFY